MYVLFTMYLVVCVCVCVFLLHLEVCTCLFWYNLLAQKSAVFKHFVEVVHIPWGVLWFAGDHPNPFQGLVGQLLAVFAVDLEYQKLQSNFVI